MIRQAIRIGLNNLGIRDIVEANGLVAAHKAMADGGFDAVILDAQLDGQDSHFLLRELRLGRLGPDPFAVGILLLAAPSHSKLKMAVDSGADDLLLIPFSPDQLALRLGAFRSRRKPFVVTHDYLGPDRRKAARPGERTAVTITPPNPLAARSAGIPPERYVKLVEQAKGILGIERIKRLALATEWECRSMLTTAAGGHSQGDLLITSFYKLETLLGELAERVSVQLRHDRATLDEMMDKVREAKGRVNDLKLADFDVLHVAARRIALTYAGS